MGSISSWSPSIISTFLSYLAVTSLILFGITDLVYARGSTIQFLPGFEGPLPFHLETGYIGVGESENNQLFYYFVKSERNPEKDPLVLWHTGGPFCTALYSLVQQIGPLKYKLKLYDGSLPTLVLNEYAWTKVSNIIFIDSPVATGYSYPKNSSLISHFGDLQIVDNLVEFVNKWLIDHPEFKSNPLYISGVSYSGMIAPILTQKIANGYYYDGDVKQTINLQGFLLGSPKLNDQEKNSRVKFAHGMSLISNELYESLEVNCQGQYYENLDPNNAKCLQVFEIYTETVSGIKVEHVLEPKCTYAISKAHDVFSERRSLGDHQNSETPIECKVDYVPLLMSYWANDPIVREALNIRKGTVGEWLSCNTEFHKFYKKDVATSLPYIDDLSTKGYRSLIHSGDHDMVATTYATEATIKSLNYSIVDDWRPWVVHGQVAGFTRTYANRLTFAVVRGGGHPAPEYKPKESFAMFKRWIDNQRL